MCFALSLKGSDDGGICGFYTFSCLLLLEFTLNFLVISSSIILRINGGEHTCNNDASLTRRTPLNFTFLGFSQDTGVVSERFFSYLG